MIDINKMLPGKNFYPGGNEADETFGITKKEGMERLEELTAEIRKLQDIQMAHEKFGLLFIFQGMDGAGKDSAIKNILSALDPQGVETKMFKSPTKKELKHDYLWRAACSMPARGQIGIFNRSYYERVLLERVHIDKFKRWNIPGEVPGEELWKRIFDEINNFEQYQFNNGIRINKFYLNMTKEKQRENLLERLEREDKKWKFSLSDVKDREKWEQFMEYYNEAIKKTHKSNSPWYIIPNNNRWFARLAVAEVVAAKLKELHQGYPELDKEQKDELENARRMLENE
jgi:PPK2 family polyphosphate:nucleotide phosphotransferase